MATFMLGQTCVRCAYPLQGLAPGAPCPECGFPADASGERTMQLRSADPDWVESLAGGMHDLCLAIWILGGGMVAVLVISLLIESLLGLNMGLLSNGGIGDYVLLAIAAAAMALHIRGCVRLWRWGHPEFAAAPWVRWVILLCGSAVPVLAGLQFVIVEQLIASGRSVSWAYMFLAQVVILAWFFALAAALEHYEKRTMLWTDGMAQRHRNVRKNLYGLIIVLLMAFWYRGGMGATGDPGLTLFGLAYLFMTFALVRVRDGIEEELVTGKALAIARAELAAPDAGSAHHEAAAAAATERA
jgi:hypothetical protein